ncbi:MAG: lytic transglycosylase domain-containing protein [Alphaproteobacteria bacterium]|jgi:hypothetical protein|nr:lytic transglycosylase domain-containing protein [Alphaproteobacteria bacterium]
MKRFLLALSVYLPLAMPSAAAPLVYTAREANQAADPLLVCHRAITVAEYTQRLPSRLLEAIAMTESGRQHPITKAAIAWPWTVMAEGRGRFFDTKAEAIAEVEKIQKKGVKNIDVGCMQVNLHHHKGAFENLDEAFDPQTNVNYAASFMRRLYDENNSWVKAIGNYHSRTDSFHVRYRDKVLARWRGFNRKQGEGETAVASSGKGEPTTASSTSSENRQQAALAKPVNRARAAAVPPAQQQAAAIMEQRRQQSRLRVFSGETTTYVSNSTTAYSPSGGVMHRYRYMTE